MLSNFAFSQQIQPEWTVLEATEGGSQMGLPIILIDSNQNVIYCSAVYHPGPVLGFSTSKYTSDGIFLWKNTYQTNATDLISAAAVDEEGSVYVGGRTFDQLNSNFEFVVFKYASNGDTLWDYRYNFGTAQGYQLSDIFVLDDDRIILTGSFIDVTENNAGLLMVCLDKDANVIWEARYDIGNAGIAALDAVQLNDRIVVWGRTVNSDGSFFLKWEVSSSGQHIDTKFTESYTDDFSNYFHTDNVGNFYVGDFNGEYKISKFNRDGVLSWIYKKDVVASPSGVTARTYAIQTDANLSVYFSGVYFDPDSIYRVNLTTKIDSNGTKIWEKTMYLNDGMPLSAVNAALILDDGSYIVACVKSINVNNNEYESAICSFDPNGNFKIGMVDVEDVRNYANAIKYHGDYYYIGGTHFPTPIAEDDKQFIIKIDKDAIVDVQEVDVKFIPLQIRPTPFTNTISINFPEMLEYAEVSLLTIKGQLLQTIEAQYSSEVTLLNLQHLPPGLYTIQVIAGNKRYVGKAVKAQ